MPARLELDTNLTARPVCTSRNGTSELYLPHCGICNKKANSKRRRRTKAECHDSLQKVTAALSCRVIKIMVPLIAKATPA